MDLRLFLAATLALAALPHGDRAGFVVYLTREAREVRGPPAYSSLRHHFAAWPCKEVEDG